MNALLTFVQVSDSHIGAAPDDTLKGQPTLPYLERLIALVNAFPQQPDFVVHTGDLSTDRSPESDALAAPVMARLKAPVYYVCGNHDDADLLRDRMGAPAGAEQGAPLDYAFDVKGERFVVLDTVGPVDPRGHVSEAQLDFLRRQCTPDGPPLTIFMHHSPFPVDSPWADENIPIDNADALHAALLPARGRLRSVFCGHLHRAGQYIRDGVAYVIAASACPAQFLWWPWNERVEVDEGALPSFNVVRYFADYVLATHHTFSL